MQILTSFTSPSYVFTDPKENLSSNSKRKSNFAESGDLKGIYSHSFATRVEGNVGHESGVPLGHLNHRNWDSTYPSGIWLTQLACEILRVSFVIYQLKMSCLF
jgi:hypothetical protein